MKKEPVTPKKPVRKTTPAATRLRRPATPKVASRAEAGGGTAATAAPDPISPTEADVARRAYEIFLGRDGADGDPVADWLQAEQELRSA